MLRKAVFILFIVFSFSIPAKPPSLSLGDLKTKMNRLLKAHVTYKKITPDLTKKIILNFIEELDPSKTYFLKDEIDKWIDPSTDTLNRFFHGLNSKNFSCFEEIYTVMIDAINRRREVERQIATNDATQDVNYEQIEQIGWVTSKTELIDKLLKIKSLQSQVAEKLVDETKGRFFQRIKKRRMHRENEIIGKSEIEKQQQLYVVILKAFSSALDPHTCYFTPNEANQFMIQVQQRLFGIGAQLKDNLNGLSVITILEKGPAAKSGKLKINDLIIAVDKEPIIGIDITEAVGLIRGKKDTAVSLTILRECEENNKKKTVSLNIELIRGEVVLEDTRLETSVEPYGDGVIGYCKLYSFYQDPKSSSSQDLKKALETLQKKHNLKGLILDVRNNVGGLLNQAVNISGLFISKGIVASIKDSSGYIQHQRSIDNLVSWDGPLIVLTNRASASASEIVAQSLQDYGRALVIGDDKTFGKGSFQVFSLDANTQKVHPSGEQKVTMGLYYTVSGKSPQLVGVKPDLIVPGILSEVDIGEEFAKFPLPNDQIEEHFIDDLSDIPMTYRKKFGLFYKHNLQPKLDMYAPYITTIKSNSDNRIKANKNYQSFLKEIKKKKFDNPIVNSFLQSDLQLLEANNIMKDLIFLIEMNEKYAPTY